MEIIQRLKQKRKEIAVREGKELFMILSNATIDEMARVLPQNKEELLAVKGWGEKKLQKYGDEFLKVLHGEKNSLAEGTNNLEMFAASLTNEQPSLFQTRRISLKNPLKEKNVSVVAQKQISEKIAVSEQGIVSVSEFLGNVNLTLSTLGLVKIKGEIDDVGLRTGYAFFELKDSLGGFTSEASLGCFVGWRCFDAVKHLLESGMEVVISGYPKIYLKNGSFRLEVTDIEPVGEGALQKAFEALKRKLEDKGYFDQARKRPIPQFIRKIGLITSMSGAAVIDFQKNLGPCGFQVQYMDVRVEGDSAEENIVQAIRSFNEQKTDFDVLVLIRGGGNLQSLKAFNSEKVADALYYSRIPVITGIGHERDETIAGFVSDLNCSTPTAVANFLHTQQETLQNNLEVLSVNLVRTLVGRFDQNKSELEHQVHYLVLGVERMLHIHHAQINSLYEKLRYSLQKIFIGFQTIEKSFIQSSNGIQIKISEHNFQNKILSEKLVHTYTQKMQTLKQNMTLLSEKITCLNPEAVLQRGYSIAYDKNGRVLRRASDAKTGETISVRLFEGKITTEIKTIEK